jgi:Mn-dependent DtxR family transcriptional regulator
MGLIDRVSSAGRALTEEGPKRAVENWKENKRMNEFLEYGRTHNTYKNPSDKVGRKANSRGGD